jgi:hypothetical protein
MTAGANVLDHGSSKPGRYLRQHRLRITLWVAAVEALLVLVHVIDKWAVYALAILAIGFWIFARSRFRSQTARQLAWIFAASQAIVVLVPATLVVAKWLAIGVIALVAVIALVVLFGERDRV